MYDTETIYADYQSTTPVDPRVIEKMAPHWRASFGNPHSSDHVVGWQAAKAVEQSKAAIAGLIGADRDEIIFTSGATEANNLALFGLARRAPADKRRILVGATEHKCVLAAAHALEVREDFTVEEIPVDREGFIDLDALAKMLDETTLAVSIMAVNNEIGTIQDIARVAEIIADSGAVFHCDAAQAACAMDTSGLAVHADLISLSGHKIYGPQGIGALYIRRHLHGSVEPIIYGGGQQNDLRSGTVPVPLCVGMAAAAEILQTGEGAEERIRVAGQRDAFVERLQGSGNSVTVNGPICDRRHPGNANLRIDGFVAQEILGALQPHVAASTGSACTSGIPEPSHVLRATGLSPEQADASIRFSFGRFTTDEELNRVARLMLGAVDSLVTRDQE
ncbi:MAG: cysteine desulfurase family protein [Caldilineaceae bacterium]|nr:cysteine desulfurase family protein [Caldilineaceae bacterium]